MAYNKQNYYKRIKPIIDLYKTVKYEDVTDTYIVRVIFPKHGIFISYRQWMNLKDVRIPKEI